MRWSISSLCLALGLFYANPSRSEEPLNRIITTTATATVRYQPDAVRIQFRLRNIDASQNEARKANQKTFKEVDEKLAALKIKDLKITVGPLSSSLSTTRMGRGGIGGGPGGGGGGGPAVEARSTYSAMQAVTLLVRDSEMEKLTEAIEKIEKLLVDVGVPSSSTVVDDDLGTRSISSGIAVTLFRRDDGDFREQALTQAVQKAMRHAKALAKGAGVEIKEVASITEHEGTTTETYQPPVRTSPRSGFGGSPINSTVTSPAYQHELEVTVRVTVKCRY